MPAARAGLAVGSSRENHISDEQWGFGGRDTAWRRPDRRLKMSTRADWGPTSAFWCVRCG